MALHTINIQRTDMEVLVVRMLQHINDWHNGLQLQQKGSHHSGSCILRKQSSHHSLVEVVIMQLR